MAVDFRGRYKSNTGLFAGAVSGTVDTPIPTEPTPPSPQPPIPPPEGGSTEELLSVMIQNQAIQIYNQVAIVQNQILDRISYERNNAVGNDSLLYDWAEEVVEPGFQVTFSISVPDGKVLFLEYWNVTYNANTYYIHEIDSVTAPTLPNLTEPLQDFGDHGSPFFNPPHLCYANVSITAANLGILPLTYGIFMRGWFRDSTKVNPDYVGTR